MDQRKNLVFVMLKNNKDGPALFCEMGVCLHNMSAKDVRNAKWFQEGIVNARKNFKVNYGEPIFVAVVSAMKVPIDKQQEGRTRFVDMCEWSTSDGGGIVRLKFAPLKISATAPFGQSANVDVMDDCDPPPPLDDSSFESPAAAAPRKPSEAAVSTCDQRDPATSAAPLDFASSAVAGSPASPPPGLSSSDDVVRVPPNGAAIPLRNTCAASASNAISHSVEPEVERQPPNFIDTSKSGFLEVAGNTVEEMAPLTMARLNSKPIEIKVEWREDYRLASIKRERLRPGRGFGDSGDIQMHSKLRCPGVQQLLHLRNEGVVHIPNEGLHLLQRIELCQNTCVYKRGMLKYDPETKLGLRQGHELLFNKRQGRDGKYRTDPIVQCYVRFADLSSAESAFVKDGASKLHLYIYVGHVAFNSNANDDLRYILQSMPGLEHPPHLAELQKRKAIQRWSLAEDEDEDEDEDGEDYDGNEGSDEPRREEVSQAAGMAAMVSMGHTTGYDFGDEHDIRKQLADAGFKTNLHTHQLESLARMRDGTKWTVDKMFYVEHCTPGGGMVYILPVLGEIRRSLPSKRRVGTILADSMGMGKTAVALALICSEQHAKFKHDTLAVVVVPTALVAHWKNETFTHTNMIEDDVLVVTRQMKRVAKDKLRKARIVIISEDTIKSKDTDIVDKLTKVTPGRVKLLFVDECQGLGANGREKDGKLVNNVGKITDANLDCTTNLLSATPIAAKHASNLSHLYTQFQLLGLDFLVGDRNAQVWEVLRDDPAYLEALRWLSNTMGIRHTFCQTSLEDGSNIMKKLWPKRREVMVGATFGREAELTSRLISAAQREYVGEEEWWNKSWHSVNFLEGPLEACTTQFNHSIHCLDFGTLDASIARFNTFSMIHPQLKKQNGGGKKLKLSPLIRKDWKVDEKGIPVVDPADAITIKYALKTTVEGGGKQSYSIQNTDQSGKVDHIIKNREGIEQKRSLVRFRDGEEVLCGYCKKLLKGDAVLVSCRLCHLLCPSCVEQAIKILPRGEGRPGRRSRRTTIMCPACQSEENKWSGQANRCFRTFTTSASLRVSAAGGDSTLVKLPRNGSAINQGLCNPGDFELVEKETAKVLSKRKRKFGEEYEYHHAMYPHSRCLADLTFILQNSFEDGVWSPKYESLRELIRKLYRDQNGNIKVLIIGEENAKSVFALTMAKDALTLSLLKANGQSLLKASNILHLGDSAAAKSNGEMVDQFQTDPNAKICLLPFNCSTGLNLNAAKDVIVLSPHDSYAREEQAIARAIRIGSPNNEVRIYRLFMKGTVEEDRAKKRTNNARLHNIDKVMWSCDEKKGAILDALRAERDTRQV